VRMTKSIAALTFVILLLKLSDFRKLEDYIIFGGVLVVKYNLLIYLVK
jgi:hypothetical protein